MNPALKDIVKGLSKWKTWLYLAYLEIKRRYSQSVIGPNWTVISNTLFVVLVSILYAGILNEKALQYGAYLCFGFVLWTMLSESATEGSTVYIRGRKFLNSGGNSFAGVCLSFIFTKVLLLLHNIPLLAITWILAGGDPFGVLLSIVGLLILVVNIFLYTFWVGAVAARFRDLTIAIQTVMRMMFFLTPIIWSAESAPGSIRQFFCTYNPFHYMLSIFRDTALYGSAVPWAWTVVGVLTLLNFICAITVFTRVRKQIIYWVQ
jgi:ABC-2 type transport system permease protein/lipopolysaccharide transport system permease protein